MIATLLAASFLLAACGDEAKFNVDFTCDLSEGPRLAQVKTFDVDPWKVNQAYVGLPGDELYTCLPSGAFSYVDSYYRVIKSVEVKGLKKGDIVAFYFENQFTNEEEFEHSLVTYVIVTDSPINVHGRQVADAIGDNILGRNTIHHNVRARDGVFVATEEDTSSVFVNLVAYAAHGYGQHGVGDSGVKVDVGYGQTSIVVLRY